MKEGLSQLMLRKREDMERHHEERVKDACRHLTELLCPERSDELIVPPPINPGTFLQDRHDKDHPFLGI